MSSGKTSEQIVAAVESALSIGNVREAVEAIDDYLEKSEHCDAVADLVTSLEVLRVQTSGFQGALCELSGHPPLKKAIDRLYELAREQVPASFYSLWSMPEPRIGRAYFPVALDAAGAEVGSVRQLVVSRDLGRTDHQPDDKEFIAAIKEAKEEARHLCWRQGIEADFSDLGWAVLPDIGSNRDIHGRSASLAAFVAFVSHVVGVEVRAHHSFSGVLTRSEGRAHFGAVELETFQAKLDALRERPFIEVLFCPAIREEGDTAVVLRSFRECDTIIDEALGSRWSKDNNGGATPHQEPHEATGNESRTADPQSKFTKNVHKSESTRAFPFYLLALLAGIVAIGVIFFWAIMSSSVRPDAEFVTRPTNDGATADSEMFPAPINEVSYLLSSAQPDAESEHPEAGFDHGSVTPGFVRIGNGFFTMGWRGLTKEGWDASQREHKVTLTNDFEIGRYEVTQSEFSNLLKSPQPRGRLHCDNCPMLDVSWHQAVSYCNSLYPEKEIQKCFECRGAGKSTVCRRRQEYESPYECPGYRLPTEAEWEYAARGGDYGLRIRPGEVDRIAWYVGNSGRTPHDVGRKKENGSDLHDILGNAWEWCLDAWRPYRQSEVSDPFFDSGLPRGNKVDHKVLRGGSFLSEKKLLNISYRRSRPSDAQREDVGFRCARTLLNNSSG